MSRMLIIGGSDAGISAALRIKEIDARADVTVVVADAYPSFSICGLPFFLSGEVPDWQALAHTGIGEIEKQGVRLLLDHRAESIQPDKKAVRLVSPEGQIKEMPYDRLLIATGAEPARPPIGGLEESGVFFLRWMADGFALQRFIEKEKPRRPVIIGGGYIGLEMADALVRRGMEPVLLEFAPEILTTMDANMARLIRAELESNGVKIMTGWAVQNIEHNQEKLVVHAATGEVEVADMVLVATGVKASTRLAQTAGIILGAAGAVRVDRNMATNVRDIWAAGDCAETWHRILETNVYMPLGTTAHKQGRVAGENMAGGQGEFQGTLGTQAVKIFDLIAAGTGLRDRDAVRAGFNPLTVELTAWDHNIYYPGAAELHINITGDKQNGRLLGAQIVGHHHSEVSKRIDIVAAAIYQHMQVSNLCDIDLSYTPPLSSPWDPVQKAAMQWCAVAGGKI